MTTIRSAELQVNNDGNGWTQFTYEDAQLGDRVVIMVFGGNQVTGAFGWTQHNKMTGQEAQGGVWSRVVTADVISAGEAIHTYFYFDGGDPVRAGVIVINGDAPLTLIETGRDGAVGTTFPAYDEDVAGDATDNSTVFYLVGSRNSTGLPSISAGPTLVGQYAATHTAGFWRQNFATAGPISETLSIPSRTGAYRAVVMLGESVPYVAPDGSNAAPEARTHFRRNW